MAGDFQDWSNEPSPHKAPVEVNRKLEQREDRRGLLTLLFWTLVILAGAGWFVWHLLK